MSRELLKYLVERLHIVKQQAEEQESQYENELYESDAKGDSFAYLVPEVNIGRIFKDYNISFIVKWFLYGNTPYARLLDQQRPQDLIMGTFVHWERHMVAVIEIDINEVSDGKFEVEISLLSARHQDESLANASIPVQNAQLMNDTIKKSATDKTLMSGLVRASLCKILSVLTPLLPGSTVVYIEATSFLSSIAPRAEQKIRNEHLFTDLYEPLGFERFTDYNKVRVGVPGRSTIAKLNIYCQPFLQKYKGEVPFFQNSTQPGWPLSFVANAPNATMHNLIDVFDKSLSDSKYATNRTLEYPATTDDKVLSEYRYSTRPGHFRRFFVPTLRVPKLKSATRELAQWQRMPSGYDPSIRSLLFLSLPKGPAPYFIGSKIATIQKKKKNRRKSAPASVFNIDRSFLPSMIPVAAQSSSSSSSSASASSSSSAHRKPMSLSLGKRTRPVSPVQSFPTHSDSDTETDEVPIRPVSRPHAAPSWRPRLPLIDLTHSSDEEDVPVKRR